MRALVIGGGFAGCSAAHMLSMIDGVEVLLIESSSFLGAGNRTHWKGGHPYTFGPRHFLSANDDVYRYLNDIVRLRLCPEHEFITYVEKDESFYSYPINISDIPRMPESKAIQSEISSENILRQDGIAKAQNFEEYWIASVGNILYDKFVDNYTRKMWCVEDNRAIDTFSWSPKGVTLKKGSSAAWEGVYSGYPYAADGYNSYFAKSTKNAKVFLNHPCEVIDVKKKEFVIQGESQSFDVVVSTISPDLLFENANILPYIGRRLELVVLPVEQAFPKDVYFTYYAGIEAYTRIVEYKKFTRHDSSSTLIGIEYPEINARRDYPLPIKAIQREAQKLFSQLPEFFYSIGRSGSYLYQIDIDDCIEQAMEVARQVRARSFEGTVACEKYRFHL